MANYANAYYNFCFYFVVDVTSLQMQETEEPIFGCN